MHAREMLNANWIQLDLPDLWQQEAVRFLRAGRDVVVDAPTGAGKTLIFEIMVRDRSIAGQAIYTVPTRALANDKRLEWTKKWGHVGICTGDVAEDLDAPVVVATLETQREALLRGEGPKLLVIDEYQMLADPVRGLAYEIALAAAPPETQLLLLSGSVANARDVVDWLSRLGRKVELVATKVRPVPLEEIHVEQFEKHAPKRITGFWPRLAAEALMSNLGPLLIFATHRNVAEKIARQIASSLPAPDPLVLTDKQEQVLGKDLSAMLRQRVACHHSGLSYAQRAGVIEPLAKAGQLRVVAATMGLAAGINFSMRSVMVADTMYFDGQVERQLRPDELLQMFGRAGRRGLDEIGYVICTDRSPRLADANPRHLRRSNQVDWPSLLRAMHHASAQGLSPFDAAVRMRDSLFSKQNIVLGFEASDAAPVPKPQADSTSREFFGLGPKRVEVFNSVGSWEEKQPARIAEVPLGQALIYYKNHLDPALQAYDFVNSTFAVGRVCRLHRDGNWMYGKELPLAIERAPRQFFLTKNIRSLTGLSKDTSYSYDQLDDRILPLLKDHLCGGRVCGIAQRGDILVVQIDFSRTMHPVYFDLLDAPLVSPDEREVRIEVTPSFRPSNGSETVAPSHTAAYAWRKLGLIESDGTLTARGAVASCFQGGEGLAIAAALDDPTYPLTELAYHIANLRGGRRFQEALEAQGSQRLATACLQAYGAANFEGYLEMGVPPGYAEGAAEVVAALIQDPHSKRDMAGEHFGEGDFERALVEWLSLLRQIKYAPDFPWERWQQFKEVCAIEREKHVKLIPSRDLPTVPVSQIAKPPNLHIIL